jgi:predicted DNA-binding transcriptional regulator AlpA
MNTDIILHSYSKEDFKELIRETLQNELSTFFSKENKSDNQRYLTRAEVMEILKISAPTLSKYQKNGLIKTSRIGNSVRFKSEDIEQSIHNIKSVKYLRGVF